MRLVTFQKSDGATSAGLLDSDAVIDLAPLGFHDALSFIQAGERALDAARGFTDGPRFPLAGVRLLAPILSPPRIFCIGLNYRDHAVESKMEIPKVPAVFLKLSSAVTGPGFPIVLPPNSKEPDYEAEFAFVIGKPARDITAENWKPYVFGYTILNDVSARDIQLATSQWTLGKSFETFAPFGPAIVTQEEVPDPHALDIRLSIDGETLQNSNTRELIFKIPDLIQHLSSIVTLLPGDIISTGTPSGVGLGRTPRRWLRPGETVAIEIESIGTLVNPVTAQAA